MLKFTNMFELNIRPNHIKKSERSDLMQGKPPFNVDFTGLDAFKTIALSAKLRSWIISKLKFLIFRKGSLQTKKKNFSEGF